MDAKLIVRDTEAADAGGAVLRLTGSLVDLQLDALTGESLYSTGVRVVHVEQCVQPGDDILPFVWLLREAAGYGVGVTWRGNLGHHVDPQLLHHLPPPVSGAEPGLNRWRATFRYGLCYYRVGPGFLLIVDHRRTIHGATSVLRDPDEIATLRGFTCPGPAAGTAAFARLCDKGLVLRHGGAAVSLPYRLRRWPIPCTAI
jgi:Family of unknown function (DUF5825)